MTLDTIGLGNALTDILVRLPDDAPLARLGLQKGIDHRVGEQERLHTFADFRSVPYEILSGGSCASALQMSGIGGGAAAFARGLLQPTLSNQRRAESMTFDMFGLGNALTDILVRLPEDAPLARLGLQKGIVHLVSEPEWLHTFADFRSMPHEIHSGGSCANVLCTAALLGAQVSFCGQVGDDLFGQAYARALASICGRHRLHVAEVGHTGKCLSLISPDAERTMVVTLGCAIELEPENFSLETLLQSRLLHLTGYLFTGGRMGATARLALETARTAGIPISFDVSDPWVVATHRELMWDVISNFADVVFTNAEEARALTDVAPEEAIDVLASRCKVAVVKLGSRGSLIRTEGRTLEVGVQQVQAVDTTGAGDAYAAGFLYGRQQGLSLEDCGRLASRVAAETVTQTGAVVHEPGRLRRLFEQG